MAKLSVCMIARNEAANLARSLASVRGVADEIVVVDTGSTDDSVRVAEEHGASVGYLAWCDDFAAARNAALDMASGDWILWLDADEALMSESVGELRRAMQRKDVLGYLVVRRDLMSEGEPKQYTQMWQLRLFRNRADLRLRGRCHPDFHPSLTERAAAAGKRVSASRIMLEHWGYVGTLREQKLRRALRLIELELADRPGQLYYLTELFRTQKQLGEKEAAAETLREVMRETGRFVGEAEAPNVVMALVLEMMVQLPADVMEGPWTPGLAKELAERWFPNSPPLLWLTGQQDFMSERFEASERKLRRLVEMGRTHVYDMTCSFDPKIIGDDARMNLAVCLVRQGKLDEAEAILVEMSRGGSHAEAAMGNLKVVRELKREFGSRPGKRRR